MSFLLRTLASTVTTRVFSLPTQSRALSSSASGSNSNNDNNKSAAEPPVGKLSQEERDLIEGMLRVNQAGELGADWIYRGQYAVLEKTDVGPVIQHMWDQEKEVESH